MQLNDSTLLQTQGFINGQWRDAASGKTFDVTNPATGELLAVDQKVLFIFNIRFYCRV